MVRRTGSSRAEISQSPARALGRIEIADNKVDPRPALMNDANLRRFNPSNLVHILLPLIPILLESATP